MKNTIYFDLDGTLVNLYNVPNWLQKIRNEDTSPFLEAEPLVNFSLFARYVNCLQKQGVRIGVITWTTKCSTQEYHNAVASAKREYLARHLPSVKFDEIHILPYGEPKEQVKKDGDFLVDDEYNNLANWGNGSIKAENIMNFLKEEVTRIRILKNVY